MGAECLVSMLGALAKLGVLKGVRLVADSSGTAFGLLALAWNQLRDTGRLYE